MQYDNLPADISLIAPGGLQSNCTLAVADLMNDEKMETNGAG
jgi:hypothetical protein